MPSTRSLYAVALAVIFAAGLGLRFYRFAAPGSRADPAAPLAALPPGLDSDEAFHTLAALRLTRSSQLVPFFKIDQGIPAAMIYLIAFVFQFTGPVAEGGRIASAVAGVAAFALLPLLAARLFPGWQAAVVFTAAHTAVTFWFVNFSRIGLEQMTAAALILAAVAAFWRWHEKGGRARAVAAGLASGLALYSYPAAYFLPLALAAYALYALTVGAPRWQPGRREIALNIAAFAIAASPLIIFFAKNPEWAVRRSSQVAGDPAASPLLIPGAFAQTVGALFWQGDGITRHNIPGRPLLDPVQSAFFLLGLIYSARRWRESRFGLLLIWFSVMLLPAALSASPQHFGRMVGDVPAVMLMCGVGGAALWQWALGRRWPPAAVGAALAGALLFSAARTAYDYFVLWPRTPDYLGTFDFPERLQAEAISAQPEAAAYLSPSDRRRSMFQFLWRGEPRAQSFNGRVCSLAPYRAERRTVWLLNSLEDTRTPSRLAALFDDLQTDVIFVDTGTVVVSQLSLPAGAAANAPGGLIGRVGDMVELLAAEEITPPARGLPFTTQLTWRVRHPPDDNWTAGFYLLNQTLQVVAQDDRQPCDNSYLTSDWRRDELIVEERTLNLPPDLPSDEYLLGLAYYRLSDGQRLPVIDSHGADSGTLLKIRSVVIP